MDDTLHQEAMAVFDEARMLQDAMRDDAAREKFAEAAVIEERCYNTVPTDEPRTRRVVVMNAAALWVLAGEFARASAFLSRPDSPLTPREFALLWPRELFGQNAGCATARAEP